MRGALSLGKILGIKVYIHFTFFLIFLWVGYQTYQAGGRILFQFAVVSAVFLSVLLHEFGHALAARRYGIATRKIVLLPIGGVAQIEHMPEKPAQELFVTIMGPVVNLAIALVLSPIVIPLYLRWSAELVPDAVFYAMTNNFFSSLFIYNCLLLVFNLIPAFPMDGGRILRALLSMRLGLKKATRIAARIGQALAIVIIGLGIYMSPMWILLGVFVFAGAEMELRMVSGRGRLRGLTVAQVLQNQITILRAQDPVHHVTQHLLAGNEKDFLVEEGENLVGILTHEDLIQALAGENTDRPVGEFIKTEVPVLSPDQPIEDAMHLMMTHHLNLLPVFQDGQLLGVVTHQGISELLLLQNNMPQKGRKALFRLIQNRALGRVR